MKFETIHNWHIVQLTDKNLIGSLSNGKTITVNKIYFLNTDMKILVTRDTGYFLGEPDKVWLATMRNNVKQFDVSLN